ncbi:MAG: glycosyltransferase [Chlamydiota bacterium]
MDKIRVAHIIYGLKLAGAEMVVWALTSTADRGRYVQSVITFDAGGPVEGLLREKGIPVICVPKRGRYDVTVLWRLARVLRAERIDVVHTHLFGADAWGRVAAWMARTPFIVSSLHMVDCWLTPFQIAVERWTSFFAHRLIAVSEEVKRFYVSGVGVSEGKVTVVYNGIDCAGLPAAVDGVAKRRELGLQEGGLVVGVAARLEPQKEIFTWLRAARLLAQEYPRLEFVIAGDGSQRREIELFNSSLGMAGKVHFLGVRRDMYEIMAICDCMVFSSRLEGFSIAILESMASGKAVVATRVGGNSEMIDDGINGVLVPVGDPDAIARAVGRLLRDEHARRRMGEAARKTVRERFSVETMTRSICDIYEEGIRDSHRPT